MKGKTCLTVTLNPAVDRFEEIDALRPGTDHRVSRTVTYAGGKGINVCRALKILGVPARATGFLGGASGEWIRRELGRERIPSDFIPVAGETRTNFTVRDSRVTRILELGTRVSVREKLSLRRSLSREGSAYPYVIYSGSCPPGAGTDFYRLLIGACRRPGQKIFLDTSGPALRQGLRAAPYGVKPNREEAEFIVGGRVRSLTQVRDAVRAFHRFGVTVVLLSLGPAGLVGSDGTACWRAEVPRVGQPAAVGCGDAALAGYICAEIRNRPFPERVAFAAAAGTANALSSCPGRLARPDFERIRKRVRVAQIG